MPSIKVSQEVAQELLDLYKIGDTTEDWEDFPVKFKLVKSEMVDTSRWSHIYGVVYEDLATGKFYYSTYSTGATECQDEAPYEYEKEVEMVEVVKKEKVIVVYEAEV